jgi:hypothetical protein
MLHPNSDFRCECQHSRGGLRVSGVIRKGSHWNEVPAIGLVCSQGETQMAERDHDPEDGKQIPARPHDTGSQANETVDGLDSETEALRHATEDAPPQPKIEQTPVFDRANLPPKI